MRRFWWAVMLTSRLDLSRMQKNAGTGLYPVPEHFGGVCYPAGHALGGVENPAERFRKDIQYPSGGKSLSPEEPLLTAITACLNRPWMPGTSPGMTKKVCELNALTMISFLVAR
ncbi:hypothetical protein [Thermopetrobacter sp. TC1]|uniref:hypothetical protein n=1 Tax=Thermopetrobacter sp. TC1 TaxID=1495045 RepID=UPI0012E08B7B|nr:hypothetical protein [Thermopetrobacter sp. TC1]